MKLDRCIYGAILGVFVIISNICAAYIYSPSYQFGKTAVIDEFSIYTIIMLLLSGFIIGYMSSLSISYVFMTTIISMSILTLVELIINKYLHNLLPFEIITGYPYVAMYVVIGFYFSKGIHKIREKGSK